MSEMAPETLSETRPMYWSIRRELWEHRSVLIAPLVVEALVLFASSINALLLPHRIKTLLASDIKKQHAAFAMPLDAAAGMVIMTAALVGVFYCLDALQGDRRDRSILFWKSLPVSDKTTVLSKASIPLVVLPLYALGLAIASQINIFLLSNVALLGHGDGLHALWSHVPLIHLWIAMTYGFIAITLWHAPIYCWLLLVSAWSRRATLVWAVLPFLVVAALEKMVFSTSYFGHFLGWRIVGWFELSYLHEKGQSHVLDPLAAMTPINYITTPGLWLGLLFAAACLVAAIRLRRGSE